MPCNRTASRKRRFMRLRTTAPPSTLPTVNPTRTPCRLPARQVEHGHVGGEMPASLLVHSLEIRVPEQAYAARETCCACRVRTGRRCHSPRVRSQHDLNPGCESSANSGKGETLLTEAGLHRHPLAALGAPARNHRAAGLGLHPRTKSVRLRAVTPVGLECALGHEKSLLLIDLGLFESE